MLLETILGGALGGVARLAPEVMKLLDAKNERKHELAMQDKALQFEQLRGAGRMAEIGAASQGAFETGALSALVESIKAQTTQSGIKWVDALTQSVRPIVTYLLIMLYLAAKCAAGAAMFDAGASWVEIAQHSYTAADHALLSAILNFWFLGRVFDKALR